MIQLKNVSKSFKDIYILKNINLTIKEKAFVVIKGKSGQGKSTLLNILGLLETPTEGQIIYKNQSIASKSQIRKFKKEDIAYIYQNYGLLENKTVLANLMLPLNISKKDMPKIIEIIQSDYRKRYLNEKFILVVVESNNVLLLQERFLKILPLYLLMNPRVIWMRKALMMLSIFSNI